MGLSISRSILQTHGGRLWATANDGPGTSFHFTLPKYHEKNQMPSRGSLTQLSRLWTTTPRSGRVSSSLIRSRAGRPRPSPPRRNSWPVLGAEAPSCLVLDLQLPGLSGLDLQKRMAEAGLEIPIVFLTGHGDIPASVQAMKAGAVEFLTKPVDEQDLLQAIQEAIERDRRTRQQHAEMRELRERYESLTAREQEVMQQVVSGLLNKQIAAELKITEYTVKFHRGHVMRKMRADSLADLVRMAENLGIRSQRSARLKSIIYELDSVAERVAASRADPPPRCSRFLFPPLLFNNGRLEWHP